MTELNHEETIAIIRLLEKKVEGTKWVLQNKPGIPNKEQLEKHVVMYEGLLKKLQHEDEEKPIPEEAV